MSEPINIIFDGPPGHEAGRFVETETDDGRGINAGTWVERTDGLWALRITELPRSAAPATPMDRREAYVAGLRALAELIEANPILPMPIDTFGISLYLTDQDTARQALAIIEAAGLDRREVKIEPTKADFGFELTGLLHGLRVHARANSQDVCIATGTTTVLTWAYEPAKSPARAAAPDSSPEAAQPPAAAPGEPSAEPVSP